MIIQKNCYDYSCITIYFHVVNHVINLNKGSIEPILDGFELKTWMHKRKEIFFQKSEMRIF